MVLFQHHPPARLALMHCNFVGNSGKVLPQRPMVAMAVGITEIVLFTNTKVVCLDAQRLDLQ